MSELKDKLVTLEGLKVLQDYFKNQFATIEDFNKLIEQVALTATSNLPRVFIEGKVSSLTSKSDSVNVKIEYEENGKVKDTFYANLKWQGTSSIGYPKKNFTIKTYSDADCTESYKMEMKDGWGKQNKFCLKANYIDPTHARNIICGRLWADAVKTRTTKNEYLEAAPMCGAVDGYHVKLYINGSYQGIYTWNIPKDGWMFAMDKSGDQVVVCCETQGTAGQFRTTNILLDESDWSYEYPDAADVSATVKPGFIDLISFVMNSSDEDFKAHLGEYLDVEAAIDYYLYAYYFCALDQLGKNMILLTYDGGNHWIPSAYDNDSTWGAYWDGTRMVSTTYRCPEDYECSNSLLWERIESLFAVELYTRYKELTAGIWSLPTIIRKIEDFYGIVPRDLYQEDKDAYPGIPTATDILQIRAYMGARKPYVDNCLSALYVNIAGIEEIILSQDTVSIEVNNILYIKPSYIPDSIETLDSLELSSNNGCASIELDGNGFYIVRAKSTGTAVITLSKGETSAQLTVNCVANTFAPAAIWDADNYTSGTTWRDSIGSLTGTLGAGVDKNEDGTMNFTNIKGFGTQSLTLDVRNLAIGTGDIAFEFEAKFGHDDYVEGGLQIMGFSNSDTMDWSSIDGWWTGNDNLYQESLSQRVSEGVGELMGSSRYSHFLIVRDTTNNQWIYYCNVNGKLQKQTAAISQNLVNVQYMGFKENVNWFNGGLKKIVVYKNVPTDEQAKAILGII